MYRRIFCSLRTKADNTLTLITTLNFDLSIEEGVMVQNMLQKKVTQAVRCKLYTVWCFISQCGVLTCLSQVGLVLGGENCCRHLHGRRIRPIHYSAMMMGAAGCFRKASKITPDFRELYRCYCGKLKFPTVYFVCFVSKIKRNYTLSLQFIWIRVEFIISNLQNYDS